MPIQKLEQLSANVPAVEQVTTSIHQEDESYIDMPTSSKSKEEIITKDEKEEKVSDQKGKRRLEVDSDVSETHEAVKILKTNEIGRKITCITVSLSKLKSASYKIKLKKLEKQEKFSLEEMKDFARMDLYLAKLIKGITFERMDKADQCFFQELITTIGEDSNRQCALADRINNLSTDNNIKSMMVIGEGKTRIRGMVMTHLDTLLDDYRRLVKPKKKDEATIKVVKMIEDRQYKIVDFVYSVGFIPLCDSNGKKDLPNQKLFRLKYYKYSDLLDKSEYDTFLEVESLFKLKESFASIRKSYNNTYRPAIEMPGSDLSVQRDMLPCTISDKEISRIFGNLSQSFIKQITE